MGRHAAFGKLSAREAKESLASITTNKNKSKRNHTTTKQKQLDSMQPSSELAAIFGVPPKPTITRKKL